MNLINQKSDGYILIGFFLFESDTLLVVRHCIQKLIHCRITRQLS